MNVMQWATAAIVSVGAAFLVDGAFRLVNAPTPVRFAAGAVLLVVLLVVALVLDHRARRPEARPSRWRRQACVSGPPAPRVPDVDHAPRPRR